MAAGRARRPGLRRSQTLSGGAERLDLDPKRKPWFGRVAGGVANGGLAYTWRSRGPNGPHLRNPL